MEKPMGNMGKTMGNMGKTMENIGKLWVSYSLQTSDFRPTDPTSKRCCSSAMVPGLKSLKQLANAAKASSLDPAVQLSLQARSQENPVASQISGER